MTRAKERGSVVGFVAVGVLLTALLVGSIYGVKHYFVDAKNGVEQVATTAGDKAENAKDTADKKSQDEKAKQEQQSDAAAEKKAAKERAAKQAAAEKKAADQQKRQQAEKQARENQNREDKDQATNDKDDSQEPLPTTGVDQLPQTGPMGDLATSAVALSVLAGAVTAYRRSLML